MSAISIYSTNEQIRQHVSGLLAELAPEQAGALRADCFSSFPEFLESGRMNPRRILLLAEEGPGSVELAASVREVCPEHHFIWFCDLDFGLFSYRLEADYFGFLPVREEKLRRALEGCRNRDGPPALTAKTAMEKGIPLTIGRRIAKILRVEEFF